MFSITVQWQKPSADTEAIIGYKLFVDDLEVYDGSQNPNLLEFTVD
jgi:hypothetical protein